MILGALNNYIRFDKIPEKLIYLRQINYAANPSQEEFVIFAPHAKDISGRMVCHKSNLRLRPDYKGTSLAIDYLTVFEPEKGFGRALINFAKNYSKKIGCNGYVFLMADGSYTPSRVPHVFYRKCGFTTLDKKLDKGLDKCIKKNKPANWNIFHNELMFYSPLKTEKTDIYKRILDRILKIFR